MQASLSDGSSGLGRSDSKSLFPHTKHFADIPPTSMCIVPSVSFDASLSAFVRLVVDRFHTLGRLECNDLPTGSLSRASMRLCTSSPYALLAQRCAWMSTEVFSLCDANLSRSPTNSSECRTPRQSWLVFG